MSEDSKMTIIIGVMYYIHGREVSRPSLLESTDSMIHSASTYVHTHAHKYLYTLILISAKCDIMQA